MTGLHRKMGLFCGLVLIAAPGLAEEPTRRGDVNQDGQVDLGDIVRVLRLLYGSQDLACNEAADANVDGVVNVADAIELSQQVFVESGVEPVFADSATEVCLEPVDEEDWGDEMGGGGASFIWNDELNKQPPSGKGKYLYSAPSGAITMGTIGGRTGLKIRCEAGQPRDHNGHVRSEIALWQPGKSAKVFRRDSIGSERWYAFSIYVPKDWWHDDHKVHLLQWHGTEDKAERGIGRNPPLTLMVMGSELRIRQLWSSRRIQTANENRKDIWRGKLERGKWMRFVFHMRWSYSSDGFLEVWKDGKKIVNQHKHPNCYNDAEGPYFNLGIYWPSAKDRNEYKKTARHTVYYDSLRVGDGRNSLKDMAP